MDDLQSFVKAFTDEEIPHVLHKSTYYKPGKKPRKDMPLTYMTMRLGEQRRNKFTPSIALLDMIGEHTTKKVMVNDKAAWLFICGNNIVSEGIIEAKVAGGPVIVVNDRDEVLGWGDRTKVGVTNKLDRGDYLRRGV